MNEKRNSQSRQATRSRLLALLYAFVAGIGCQVNVALQPTQTVEIRVVFKKHYANVTATLSGTAGASSFERSDYPTALKEIAADTPIPFEQADVETATAAVVPKDTRFVTRDNLFLANWPLRLRVFGDGALIVDTTCNVNPDTPASPRVHRARVEEGTSPTTATCTEISQGEPKSDLDPRANRDLAVMQILGPGSAPATVTQGDLVTINVRVQNLSNIQERFDVTLTDDPDSGAAGSITAVDSPRIIDLPPGETWDVRFNWATGGASRVRHVLRAAIPPVARETITGNNELTAEVMVAPPPDVSVEAVSVGSPDSSATCAATGAFRVLAAASAHFVVVDVKNVGVVPVASFAVDLTHTPPGGAPVDLPPGTAVPLAPGATAPVYIPWTPGIAPGCHRLTATIPALAGETGVTNNTRFIDVLVETHDIQAISISAPGTAVIGNPVPVTVTVSVRNNGNVNDNATVTLNANPPSGAAIPVGTQSVSVGAGLTVPVSFNWTTACIASGSWSFTATASAPNDMNAGNDTAFGGPIVMTADRQLSIRFVNPATNAALPSATNFRVDVQNGAGNANDINGVSEGNVSVTFSSARRGGGSAGTPQSPPSLNFACGERKELYLQWQTPSTIGGVFDLTVTINNPPPGDNPADNTSTTPVSVP